MTRLERKFEVIKRWGTITAGAKELEVSRSQLSYCIAKRRKVPALRAKLADALGITVEELFGDADDETSALGRALNKRAECGRTQQRDTVGESVSGNPAL